MAVLSLNDNRLLRRALVASLGLHLLLALFLPSWMPLQSQGLQPVETVSFAHLMHVQIQRRSASVPVAIPNTPHRAAKVQLARLKSELTAHTHKPHALPLAVSGAKGQIASAPHHLAVNEPAPLYARAASSIAPSAAKATVAVPTPQPQASLSNRAAEGAGESNRGGVLPFGAEQAPVLDPGALVQLGKRVGVHVTLLVTVGEDGRTKHIAFVPPLDAQIEKEVQAILADANWDAAVCGGGVSCEGMATIRL